MRRPWTSGGPLQRAKDTSLPRPRPTPTSRITSHRDGDTIYVQQHIAGARFSWNTAYSLQEAREVVRQLEAHIEGSAVR